MSRHATMTEVRMLARGGDNPDDPWLIAHVATCWVCRERLRALDPVRAIALELRGPREPGKDLWPGIAKRVEDRSDRSEGGLPRSRIRGVGVTAAAVFVLLGGLLLVRLRESEDASIPAAAEAVAQLEARYQPALRELTSLVEQRSTALGVDVAAPAAPDLAALRRARQELRRAVEDAPDSGQLLAELEATYVRERSYLVRLAEVVRP